MADPPLPRTCSVLRSPGGRRPRVELKAPGAFFHGRNSYQNHKQKTNQHTQKWEGEGEGFVKVLLGSYFYIVLPITEVFAVGI